MIPKNRKASKYNPNDKELKGTFIKVAENGVKVHKNYKGARKAFLNDFCMLKLAEVRFESLILRYSAS